MSYQYDSLHHGPPRMCYHAEFGRSKSNRVGTSKGEPRIGEHWGHAPLGWRGWPHKTSPSPCVLPRRTWSFCVKNDQSRPAFQGQSRSLEPTRIDQLSMTSYKGPITTVGLSRSVSEINVDFSPKWQFFPTRVFNVPRRWDSLDIAQSRYGSKSLDGRCYLVEKEVWRYL